MTLGVHDNQKNDHLEVMVNKLFGYVLDCKSLRSKSLSVAEIVKIMSK